MPRSSRSRSSSSRRSRSSGSRPRSGHRTGSDTGHDDGDGHTHRHRSKIKNIWAAVCSTLIIMIICTALAEPRWIHLSGGGCSMNQGNTLTALKTLGVYQFFYMGHFLIDGKTHSQQSEEATIYRTDVNFPDEIAETVYQYGPNPSDVMYNCVTSITVILMKITILLSFIAVLCSLGQFILDICGPTRRSLKILHRNGLASIFTVVLCVIINLICYWITTEVELLQKTTKILRGSKVEVRFDVSFYLIAAAGGVGVLATAANCLRRYPMHSESQSSENLLDDYDGLEPVFPPGPDTAPMSQLPPPPAYTP